MTSVKMTCIVKSHKKGNKKGNYKGIKDVFHKLYPFFLVKILI